MPLMIDGHNLIGQMPGISLSDPDDEEQLISRLQAYCARQHRAATVFFDRGLAGLATPFRRGALTVRFVAQPRSADEAMRQALGQLGGEARNWTVVSSDADVQRAARLVGARVMDSRSFAKALANEGNDSQDVDKPASDGELSRWEALFRRQRKP